MDFGTVGDRLKFRQPRTTFRNVLVCHKVYSFFYKHLIGSIRQSFSRFYVDIKKKPNKVWLEINAKY